MTLDNFRTVNLTIDKANGHFFSDQFAKEGDYDGRRLVVQITDNGVVEDLSHVDVHLGWKHDDKKNSGLNSFEAVDAGNGIFEVYYPREMLHPGQVTAVIQIVDDGKITETKNFRIKVGDSVINAQAAVEENSFTILQEALIKVNQYDNRINSLERDKADKAELEQTKQEVTAQLAHEVQQRESAIENIKAETEINLIRKRDKSVPINLNDADEEMLAAIQGGEGTTFNIESIPRDFSVAPIKTSFLKMTRNLFEGSYKNKTIGGNVDRLFLLEGESENSRTAIINIERGKTYTIKVHDGLDQNTLRVASDVKIPTTSDYDGDDRYYFKTTRHLSGGGGLKDEFTFTNLENDTYLFVNVSIEGKEPRMQVEEGESATPYTEHFFLGAKHIKDLPSAPRDFSVTPKKTTFFKLTRNLFDGSYKSKEIGGTVDRLFMFEGESENSKTAIINIERGKTYTIKVHEGLDQNTLRVASDVKIPAVSDYDSDGRYYFKTTRHLSGGGALKDEFTFTNLENDTYLFVNVSTEGKEPRMQVEEGESATPYTEHFFLGAKHIKDLPSAEKNIYEELRGNIHQRNFRVDKLFRSVNAEVYEGDVTLSDVANTTFLKYNTSAVKMTVNSPENVRLDFPLSQPLDLYNRTFALNFYMPPNANRNPRHAKFRTISIYLETPEGWVANYPDTGGGGSQRYPGWNMLIGNSSIGNASDEKSLREVTAIRISINTDSAFEEPYDIYFDSLVSWQGIRKPTVLLEFDDALNSVYQNAFPLMTERGMRGATHVITGNITNPHEAYIKNDELIRMHDVGWDICSHSVTHPYISEIDDEQVVYELEQSQKDLLSLGLKNGPQFYIAPYGDNSLYAVEQARKLYQNYRMTGYRLGQTAIPPLPYAMETINAGSRGLEGVITLVDRVTKYGGHLPLMWHGEIGETWNGNKWETGEFKDLLDYLIVKDFDVITYSDMFPGTQIR